MRQAAARSASPWLIRPGWQGFRSYRFVRSFRIQFWPWRAEKFSKVSGPLVVMPSWPRSIGREADDGVLVRRFIFFFVVLLSSSFFRLFFACLRHVVMDVDIKDEEDEVGEVDVETI